MYLTESLSDVRERALAYEQAGDWSSAIALYERLFSRSLEEKDLATVVDALRWSARARIPLELYEEAEEFADLSFEIARCNALTQEAARAVNMLAVLRYFQHDLDRARSLYEQALEMALDAGDDSTTGDASQNLGLIANIEGRPREARTLYLEAIASAVRAGDTLAAARVYNNLGIVCTDLQEWMEAQLYFDRGIELAEQVGNPVLLALLHANRAKPLIQIGELARARSSLAAAESNAVCINDQGTLAEVEVSRGIIARLEGDLTIAEAHLQRALSLSATDGLGRERALAMEGVAELWWDQGRATEALEQLRRANESFRAVGSRRDAVRAEELLARWEEIMATDASLGEWIQGGNEPRGKEDSEATIPRPRK